MPFGATFTYSRAVSADMCVSFRPCEDTPFRETGKPGRSASSVSSRSCGRRPNRHRPRFVHNYASRIRRRPSMSVRNLQHIALAVPDPTVGKKFYTDFGMEGSEHGKRIVMRCHGRDQDQVVLVEGKNRHMHHVGFGTRAEDLEA